MASEPMQVIALKDDFYRDGFSKVIWLLASVAVALLTMIALAVYLYMIKPPPVSFPVGKEWRILPPVPLDQAYHTSPEILQWVSTVMPKVLQYDFIHYNDELKSASQYFTSAGWQVFLNQLNHYVNYNNVKANQLIVTATPVSAPFILNQGLLAGRYGWWVQIPLKLKYIGNNQNSVQQLTLQVLVMRVPTANNLSGIGIQNVIVENVPTTGL